MAIWGVIMYITVKDVLELEEFREVELIAGLAGLNRRVKNVYFMEVPDIYSFIDENGLLLTTMFPIAENQEDIKTLIPKLAEQNLAGVAIKPGRYIEKIPDFMIEQANQHELPLIKLHHDANLSTLTNHILSTLLGMKTSMLEIRDKIHGKLLDLLLQGADLNQFVLSMAKIVNAPIVILDEDLKYVESSLDMNKQVVAINRVHTNFDTIDLAKTTIKVDNHLYKHEDFFVQPIQAGKESFGYLVVLQEGKVTDTQMVAIKQATILLAFLFQTEQTMLQRERNYLDNFIKDIFNERYISQSEVIEKAKVFNWNFQFPLVMLNIKLDVKESEKRLSAYYKILDSGLVERIISEAMDIPAENSKILYYNDSLICFISVAFEERLNTRLKKVGEAIISNFTKFGDIAVGISDSVFDIKQIVESYQHALLVHNIHGSSMKKTSYIEFYDDLGLYKLFYQIRDKQCLHGFVKEKLEKILEYDRKKDANLTETMQHYIKNNGNLQKTSKDLYIHYNTLRYRINKLKELGIDIENGNELMEISVAFQLYQYLKYA